MSTATGEPGTARWSSLQRRLHWLAAVLVLGQYLAQEPLREANAAAAAGETVTLGGFVVTTLHVWGGIALAAIALWRLALRRQRPVAAGGGILGARASRLVALHHRLLYALLLAMALSGALHYYGGWEAAARWHRIGKWLLGAAVALHLCGALWHLARGEGAILRGMWPSGGGGDGDGLD